MLKSSNPVLAKFENGKELLNDEKTMTVGGTINKVFVLFLIAMVSGSALISQMLMGYTDKVKLIVLVALVVGLITGLVIAFVPKLAKFLSPVYAFAEGSLLAGMSLFLELKFPGIAVQAVAGTMFAFAVMLILYKTKVIRATDKFKSVISTSLITILVLYVINIVGSFAGISIPFVSGSGPMAILFHSLVVLIASLCLITDFDYIETAARKNLPKDYEWYGAFGLLVTLVWLYIEILNLLARLRNE